MKKLLILLLVLTLAVGACSAYLYSQLKLSRDTVATLTNSLDEKNKELETFAAEEAATVLSLNEVNASLSSEIDALKAAHEAALNEITLLNEQVDGMQLLRDEIAQKDAQIVDLQSQIASAQTDLVELNEVKMQLEAENIALNEKHSTIESYVDEAVSSLPLLLSGNEVDTLWNAWEMLQEMLR